MDVPLLKRPGSALYYYATHLIYTDTLSPDRMVFWTRSVNVAIGLLLGLLLFMWSRRLYGLKAAYLTLFLFAFCPNLIAHGSVVTTDLGGVAFALLFLYLLVLTIKGTQGHVILPWCCGAALGAALLSKFTNVIFLPLFATSYIFLAGETLSLVRACTPKSIKTVVIILATSWVTVCGVYQFDRVFIPHTLDDADWQHLGYGEVIQQIYRIIPLPDSYLRGLSFAVAHDKRGHGGFLLGEYRNHGWWYYFPIAFLVKTPTLVLGALCLWLYCLFRHIRRISMEEAILIAPGVILFATSMSAGVNIGVRHILFCYPVLYILLGSLAQRIRIEGKLARRLSLSALMILPAEVLSASPHYLAFFNRISGGPVSGPKYLSDSNIDWGQDLKGLANFLQAIGNPEIQLSYFGTGVPQYYGIRYQALPTVWAYPKSDWVNSPKPARELLAVSVTNLQGTYFARHDLFAWLSEKTPIKRIGYSIYVYDITSDLESRQRLLEIYRSADDTEKAIREENMIRRLTP
jgi:hypothetical protein